MPPTPKTSQREQFAPVVRVGLIGGVVTVFMAVIGMIETFSKRQIIDGVLDMGHMIIFITFYLTGYMVLGRMYGAGERPRLAIKAAAVAGLINAAMLAALALILSAAPVIRSIFVNMTPALLDLLTFGQNAIVGSALLLAAGAAFGALVGYLQYRSSPLLRGAILALSIVLLIGLLQELIRVTSQNIPFLSLLISPFFANSGLSLLGATILFALIFGGMQVWRGRGAKWQTRYHALAPNVQRRYSLTAFVLLVILLTVLFLIKLSLGEIPFLIGFFVLAGMGLNLILAFLGRVRLLHLLLFVLVLVIPWLTGIFISDVLVNVGLYTLMGLGLNIVVGFAGLLDLGYVAFYAIGAFTVAVFTTLSPEIAFHPGINFWINLPIVVVICIFSGLLLGVPVLKIRGDYLAIVTLGFGEIIRLLFLSDFLKPYLGGSRGIEQIPKPFIGPLELIGPQELFYLVIIGCLLVAFLANRLKSSRLGRAWMAMREDEDVAQSMGVDLVKTKLLAFAIGAAFAGIAGAIFASKLGTVYPHSMKIDISINVLALLIIGGMGNIPGVILGALVLVGLPELFREFEDYRLLVYGAVLVIMMLSRPEGLLPEARRAMELEEFKHEEA